MSGRWFDIEWEEFKNVKIMKYTRRRRTIFLIHDTTTTEIYTLSLHDALPIARKHTDRLLTRMGRYLVGAGVIIGLDRKSTRLNSSHSSISYAVFCLKKKK